MRTPSTATLLTALLAGAFTAAVVAAGACSGSDGVTPTCKYNVDDAGVIHASPTGCVQFASCDVGNGDAHNCCVGADGGSLLGNDLANCLYGYGACAALDTDDAGNVACISAAGTTTSTTSSTGTGTGGGGTGGAGTGGSGTGGGGTDGGDGG